MKPRFVVRYALPFLSVVAFTSPALSQTIDNDGARQIVSDLARYLGSTVFDKNLIKVAADDDAYRLTIDFDAMIRQLPKASMMVDPSSIMLRLKPQADGTWNVANSIAPTGMFMATSPDGPVSMKWSIADGKMTGTYDPALAAFSSLTMSNGPLTLTTQAPEQTTDVNVAGLTIELESVQSAKGGIDVVIKQDMSDLTETVKVKDLGEDFPVLIKVARSNAVTKASGLQSKAFLDLLAFAVANSSEAQVKARQAELKTLLLAALPLWNNIEGSQDWHDTSIVTPLGNLEAAKLSMALSLDGITQDSALTYRIQATDLTVPAYLLPAWAVSLVPSDIDVSFGGKSLNLEKPVRTFVGAFDLNKAPVVTDEIGELTKWQFLDKQPKMVVPRSTIGNKDYRIELEGEMTYIEEKAAFHAVLDVDGYDKIVDALQGGAATDPDLQQAFTGLLAMKAFAKTMPDGRLQWVVDMQPDGSVRVNGSMLKAADPAP